MPRQARLDAPGTIHHVIIRGIEKGDIVEDDEDRYNFNSLHGKISKETDTVIYAWALLTNHAHILLRSSSVGLSKHMRRFLTGYAVSYNYSTGATVICFKIAINRLSARRNPT